MIQQGRANGEGYGGHELFLTAASVSFIISFVFVYSAQAFSKAWDWDFFVHLAAVSEWYRNFPNLFHEATYQPASDSIVLNPYTLFVSALGRLLELSPYAALQLAACLNLVFFAAAIFYFFASFFRANVAIWSSAIFIVVCLLMRQYFGWSSELSFEMLAAISSYPKIGRAHV